MIKAFIDASVLFAAIYSDKGYSFDLINLARQNKIIGITSQTVIEEVERNLGKMKKMESRELAEFIASSGLIVLEKISVVDIKPYISLVHEKDTHVVVGAVTAGCAYLVTFDNKHLDNPEVKKRIKWFKIVEPKEFLETLGKG